MNSAPNATSGPTENVGRGILLIIIAFFCVAVMSAFAKAASSLSAGVLVFFQNSISLLLFIPWALRRGPGELATRRFPLHLVRAVSGLLSQAMFFVAVKQMSLVDAVLLVNAAPLFIPMVVLVWMRTKIKPAVWAGLVVGFIGVALILKPGAALLHNPSALVALVAAIFSAVALVSVNRLSATDHPDAILFYYFLISTILTIPWLLLAWTPPTSREWLWLLGVGVFMAMSQLFIILAYRCASAQRIAPFNYSVVVFSGIIGWLVWHHVPGWLALVGTLLVCLGGILAILFGTSEAHGHALGHGHQALRGTKESGDG